MRVSRKFTPHYEDYDSVYEGASEPDPENDLQPLNLKKAFEMAAKNDELEAKQAIMVLWSSEVKYSKTIMVDADFTANDEWLDIPVMMWVDWCKIERFESVSNNDGSNWVRNLIYYET